MSSENHMHSCVFCDLKLESKEALKEHFRQHGNDQLNCNGKTKKRGRISKIQVSNMQCQSFCCDVCGMQLKSNATLITHRVRKHPQEAKIKYFCSYCGRQFPLKMNRDNHVSMEHSEELKNEKKYDEKEVSNYTCNLCQCYFYNKYAFEFHNSTNHNRVMSLLAPTETPPPSNKIRIDQAGSKHSVLFCHLCGTEYIKKFNLRKHLEIQHSEKERLEVPSELIKCKICCALFYSKRAYENHNLSHSPDDIIVHNESQRLQTVSHIDLDFDFRRVSAVSIVDKYIPRDSNRGKNRVTSNHLRPTKVTSKENEEEELSPVSDYDSSSDEENKSKHIKTC